MNYKNNITKYGLLLIATSLAFAACKKLDRPALGEFPIDTNPPGGPLKFYVAFDGTSNNDLLNAVDSIRANFPASNLGTSTDGISGKAYQGGPTSYVKYAGVNDFTKSSSFTVAFWVKKTPQAPGSGTQFAFSMNASGYSWTNTKLFLEFEDYSTTTAAAGKFYILDQWVEYTNANSMPNVLDGNWHHLAFTYDGPSSQLLCYIDGTLFRTNTVGAPLGPVDFGSLDDFTIGGPDQGTHDANTWMGFWDGAIDQFRLYGTVLSASDIQALYNNKE
jgi:hypothetical protein